MMMARTVRTIMEAAGGSAWRLAALAVMLVVGSLTLPERTAAQVMDDHIYWMVLVDELEYAPGPESRPAALDASFWLGGDYDRLWVNVEGDGATVETEGEFEAQALYSRLISPFFEVQAGLGIETEYGETSSRSRGQLVVGLQGLAPYWFEIQPQVLVSQEGDVSLTLNASYELLFTQRLILEPELDLKAAVQEVPEFGIGSGLNDLSLAGRLRYELKREFAPYVGVVWAKRYGGTADLARAAGETVSRTRFVAGLRVWY